MPIIYAHPDSEQSWEIKYIGYQCWKSFRNVGLNWIREEQAYGGLGNFFIIWNSDVLKTSNETITMCFYKKIFFHVRQDKTGENRELCSVGGGVQTTDARGNADMCSLSGLCPSPSAHTNVLETLDLVLLPAFIYFLTMSGRCTDFSTLWGLVKTSWGAVVGF